MKPLLNIKYLQEKLLIFLEFAEIKLAKVNYLQIKIQKKLLKILHLDFQIMATE